MAQLSIFDGAADFKINKPVRLIELFAGYGSQALALKYLGVDFEHWKICEWAVKSIQAYKDMHFTDDDTDYSFGIAAHDLFRYLYDRGISQDYNAPMTLKQIERLGDKKARQIYNNIQATHNLVSVCNCKGADLQIEDTDKYCYILTYSFPCQDLSKAGKSKGMQKGSGTRSGLLWEVERILDECPEKPQVLLMENVPDVVGSKNVADFAQWRKKLESIGYRCYWQILNAKDYGIPQNRARCFMVSILGDHYYDFPYPVPLKSRLKDVLEKNVDKKYTISQRLYEYLIRRKDEHRKKGNGFGFSLFNECSPYANTISARYYKDGSEILIDQSVLTRNGERPCYICAMRDRPTEAGGLQQQLEVGDSQTSNALTTVQKDNLVLEQEIKAPIKNATKQGYLEATVGDGIDIGSRQNSHRGTVQKGMAQTLKTSPEVGVIEPTKAPAYRIRKLTPRECFRLMGVKDADFDRVAKNQSDSSLYHLAGDSIVVNVLSAIFNEML